MNEAAQDVTPGDAGATPQMPASGGLRGRLGASALVIAALATGVALTSRRPDTDVRERPFVRTGAVGQTVDGRTFEASVVSVRGANQIQQRSGRPRDTGGVWVIVKVRAVARDTTTTLGHAAVRDGRGRTFLPTPRINQPFIGAYSLQPGLAVEGEVAFEVPRDAVTSLTFRLADSSDPRMDVVVEVPLAIDAAAADRWSAEPAAPAIGDVGVAG